MTRATLIENARIVDPATGTDHLGAVLIEDGIIAELAIGAPIGVPDGAEVINAKGLVLAPGLIDMRVFTGEPGKEYRETLQSAGEAAAAGGITSFVMMPDTTPVVDDGALVDFLIRRARATSKVNVLPAGAITKGLNGTEMTEYGLLKEAGAVCLTDGRHSIQSPSMLRTAMSYAANYGLTFVHHVSDTDLTGTGVMNEGLFATILGLKGIPREAETIPLARDLQLAALTGVKYHAAQISCAAAVELVAAAKKRNRAVTAGISINNLALNENDIGRYRTFFKLSTPLRSEDDRQAMIQALRDGTIDTIHSDHDPQDTEVKRQPFAEASDGAIGLETLLAAALRLVHSGDVDLLTVLRAMTSRPADILGLPSGRIAKGAPADLILFDLDYPWQVSETDIRSKSRNTSFEGARLAGKVMRTIVAGETVHTHID
ncbi:dihydroorotase [Devosia sp. J2-20]|jgi:dihydroorotase|uniref:Dihydroorotase n=1 Tax=Devosia litorisediminis TaxID=2829817 RepID=A0A942I627_9HYPH|nr:MULTISPECIES: dihydroorotase [Devosia]MBS3848378.1 dihydroorotase [Devosia litorisediminis]MCZ4345110.1 dihydroorotase [Devosia neptuniae]WDQ98542.1 dihydroorotase [Devosia sp. J2-20]|tara:strand:+ start:4341 stop:5633 length:1293 start_codon:yes stop_codon:yes gene_type:complete